MPCPSAGRDLNIPNATAAGQSTIDSTESTQRWTSANFRSMRVNTQCVQSNRRCARAFGE
jgi:hypothetical protein